MAKLLRVVASLLLVAFGAHGASYTWLDDDCIVEVDSTSGTTAVVKSDASRAVLDSTGGGHFILSVGGDPVPYCLEWHASATAVEEALYKIDAVRLLGGARVEREGPGYSSASVDSANGGYTSEVSEAPDLSRIGTAGRQMML